MQLFQVISLAISLAFTVGTTSATSAELLVKNEKPVIKSPTICHNYPFCDNTSSEQEPPKQVA